MNMRADRKNIERLIWLFTIVYFVSYVSRQGLGTILVEVIQSGFALKTTAALALTVCSITYGAGQIISGYISDRFKPQHVMFSGLLLTSACNLAVFLMPDDRFLVPVWGINGFAQALMWPPLVRLMSASFDEADYQKSCIRVSQGANVGTIVLYLVAPVVISLLNFRFVFLLSGFLALAVAFVWNKDFPKISAKLVKTKAVTDGEHVVEEGNAHFGLNAVLVTVFIMLSIVMQGALRDGVTSWTPTLLSETFNMSSSVSILSGVVLPLFAIATHQVTGWIYRKYLKNPLVCAFAIFSVGAIAALLLYAVNGKSSVLAVIFLALLVGSMHGVNIMLITMVPVSYKKYGHVSLIAGVLNSATYIGAAISTYGIAVYAEHFGWNSTILLWAGIAAVGGLLCISILKLWKKFVA